jgi:single-stranded DNA-specific DHH superfamily exonuclease
MYPEFKDIENKLINLTSTSRNIHDASIVVNGLIECYNIDSPSFLGKTVSSAKLLKINKEIEKEIEKVLINSEKILETKNNVIYRINSRFNIQSIVSNKLITIYPNKNIIICNSGSNKKIMYLEVRSKEDELLEKLCVRLKDLVEDIGGHKKAFGFSIKKEKFHEIINYFKNAL